MNVLVHLCVLLLGQASCFSDLQVEEPWARGHESAAANLESEDSCRAYSKRFCWGSCEWVDYGGAYSWCRPRKKEAAPPVQLVCGDDEQLETVVDDAGEAVDICSPKLEGDEAKAKGDLLGFANTLKKQMETGPMELTEADVEKLDGTFDDLLQHLQTSVTQSPELSQKLQPLASQVHTFSKNLLNELSKVCADSQEPACIGTQMQAWKQGAASSFDTPPLNTEPAVQQMQSALKPLLGVIRGFVGSPLQMNLAAAVWSSLVKTFAPKHKLVETATRETWRALDTATMVAGPVPHLLYNFATKGLGRSLESNGPHPPPQAGPAAARTRPNLYRQHTTSHGNIGVPTPLKIAGKPMQLSSEGLIGKAAQLESTALVDMEKEKVLYLGYVRDLGKKLGDRARSCKSQMCAALMILPIILFFLFELVAIAGVVVIGLVAGAGFVIAVIVAAAIGAFLYALCAAGGLQCFVKRE